MKRKDRVAIISGATSGIGEAQYSSKSRAWIRTMILGKGLRSANWFDAEKYPFIKCQTKRVLRSGSNVEAVGDLTIKGSPKKFRSGWIIVRDVKKMSVETPRLEVLRDPE